LIRSSRWIPWAAGAAVAALAPAWLDPSGPPFSGLPAYTALAGLCALLAWLTWREVARRDAPRWLGAVLLVALALRLGLAVAMARLLPIYGYPEEDERQAGYIFQDARLRDNDAWALGRSDESLTRAFLRPQESDQYGGLLFLSAAIYRYLSAGVHRPLLVVLPAAAFGSLAALFSWAFAASTIGRRAGAVAGWVVALYPDAVLLGASQMREPFVMAGLALALYGYSRVRLGSSRPGLTAVALGILLALFVSPPYGLVILLVIGLAWLWEGGRRPSWTAVGLLVLAALAIALTALAWTSLQDVQGGNPLSMLGDWLLSSAQYQLSLLEQGSGWVQRLFDLTPKWLHLPLATLYGLTRPLLPAALADRTGAVLWQIVEIWRSLGWFALLPTLVYAPLAALRSSQRRSLALYLGLAFWLAAVVVSFRAAGDDWDNPRYRAVFVPLMGTLAGWAWFHARSRWLSRTYVGAIGVALIFLHWYAGRYYGTPRLSLEATLAAMLGFAGLYFGGLALRDRRHAQPGLTGKASEV
jgi:4-amino-4-deoxy-L-arabinose transferase-like glycosyltransferase